MSAAKSRRRVHATWDELRVANEYFHSVPRSDSFEELERRLRPRFDLPAAVLKQWIAPHHQNEHTLENYAWIDFSRIRVVRTAWPLQRLLRLRVIQRYRRWVRSWTNATADAIRGHPLHERWVANGTWIVPPVVLDTKHLPEPPKGADVVGRYQLIEGHSRLGFLRGCARTVPACGIVLREEHEVFVLGGTPGI